MSARPGRRRPARGSLAPDNSANPSPPGTLAGLTLHVVNNSANPSRARAVAELSMPKRSR